jgi:hypothetical protein
MPGINSISKAQPAVPNSTADRQTPPPAPTNEVGAPREDRLQQQLADQLSSKIALIRQQISGANRPDPNSADGTGRILNIQA